MATEARAQQPALPVVALLRTGTPEGSARFVDAFNKGLNETGYVDGQNVKVDYHWLEDQYDRLPALMADLVRRQVAVIATPGFTPGALAAKAATATIPIVFGVTQDPVQLGLVTSLARPGGNATGINFFANEVVGSGCGFCMTWCPRPFELPCSSIRPMSQTPKPHCATCRRRPPPSGCKLQILNATTIGEIDAAFRHLCAARDPMRFSSAATHSSLTAACNLSP